MELPDAASTEIATTISTVREFQHRLRDGGAPPEHYLFRGQANHEWRVDCAAVRRLQASTPPPSDQVIGYTLVGYLANLLRDCKSYLESARELGPAPSDAILLAQLQHHGAATGLIDFTLDPLVALWFACAEHPDKDGAVYALFRRHTEEVDDTEIDRRSLLAMFLKAGLREWDEPLYQWLPRSLPGRRRAQQGLFVFGAPFIWPAYMRRLPINRTAKKKILDELQAEHNITEGRLFPDFAGYARSNSSSRPFDPAPIVRFWRERIERAAGRQAQAEAQVDLGLLYCALARNDLAVAQFTEAIETWPESIGAHVNRATARRTLGLDAEALEDYNLAIQLCEQGDSSIEKQNVGLRVAKLYHSRAKLYFALGQTEAAHEDLNRAHELGLKQYWEGNDRPLVTVPTALQKYRE